MKFFQKIGVDPDHRRTKEVLDTIRKNLGRALDAVQFLSEGGTSLTQTIALSYIDRYKKFK